MMAAAWWPHLRALFPKVSAVSLPCKSGVFTVVAQG